MSKREQFVRELEELLVCRYGPEEVSLISNMVIKSLANYEITDRCTDLVPLDDQNEKLIRRYRACLLVDGKSQGTAYQYTRRLALLSDALRKPFVEMGTYDIRLYLAMEKDRGLSNVSLDNIRSCLSAFFQWLVNDDVIQKNPVAKIKPIKCPKEVRQPFSEVELDALRSACRTTKERALVEMLVSTGVRVSELASMQVQDINLDTLTVHVIHGKGAKERITYTTAVSAKHLINYLRQRKEEGSALFYNKNHMPLEVDGIRFILNSIAKRAGVDNVHPHRFRRTFATNLSKRGMEIQEIQKLLGHANINTTMVYVATDDSRVQASYKRFTA